MARHRSREAETEDVNPRRLRRGAVKRTHIGRWAVGHDELAPGVVGPGHLQPTVIETIREVGATAGVGQILLASATAQAFASGGDYVTTDAIEYQFGFADVVAAGDSIVWPVDAVGEVQVEFKWDTYEGGGTIEIEVDGAVPAWGLVGTGNVGSEGCKRRGVHIAEGSVVKVKVTQTSGEAQTGDVTVEFSIPDPTLTVPAPDPTPVLDSFDRANNATSLENADTGELWVLQPRVVGVGVAPTGTGATSVLGVDGNQAYTTVAIDIPQSPTAAWSIQMATIDHGHADLDASVDVVLPLAIGELGGVVARYDGPGNFWGAWLYRSIEVGSPGYALILQGYGDSGATILTDESNFMLADAATGIHTVRVVVTGSTWNVYLDGTLGLTLADVETGNYTDSTLHGIGISGTARLNDYRGALA